MNDNQKTRLNEEQQRVAMTMDGPLQVVAGAGSGKTTVLMDRTKNIIENKALPSEILLVTFTKKAANELKERLVVKIGEQGKEVNAGTFHSICLQRVLKRYADEDFLATVGLSDKWEGMDANDQSRLTKQAFKEMTDEDIDYCESQGIKPKNFESFLSLVRSMGVKREQYLSAKDEVIKSKDKANPLFWINDYMQGDGIENFEEFETVALKFWERYEQLCRSKNAVDFDDILMLTCQLVEEKEDVAKKLSEEWKYIMLDEYQDTNVVQMKIMDSVAKHHGNICVVGDDQQSIYSFRGSNINVIRGFKERYPEAKMLTLTYNYRSTSEILLASNRLAGAMPNRLSNDFLSTPINKHGKKPEVRGFKTDEEEAYWIASSVSKKIKTGTNPKDIAILYRNRGVKRALERNFLNQDLPYMIYNDTSFFNRKEVQDTVAMVRFIFRPWSALSAIRFLDGANLPVGQDLVQTNSEKRGVSPHQFLSEYAMAANDVLGDRTLDTEAEKKERYHYKTKTFLKNIKSVSQMENEERIKYIPKLKTQTESINNLFKGIMEKIDNKEYTQGSIRKMEIQKGGTAIRKITKAFKKDDVDWSEVTELASEANNYLKRSVNKSNEVRLFIDTMEAMSETAKVCDIEGINKEIIKGLPKVLRDALASTWETYMASKLEKYSNNQVASDKDTDNVDSRVANVEYILDRFQDRLDDAILQAENEELSFSEVIDVALDDLVMLVDQSQEENMKESVQMMTMHASKGLEFKNVYVIGMVSDIMPGPNPEENIQKTEEELRLFYVASTRAQEELYISYPMERKNFKNEMIKSKPSGFLLNILDVVDYYKVNSFNDKKQYSNNNQLTM